jgi:hypothetical protein
VPGAKDPPGILRSRRKGPTATLGAPPAARKPRPRGVSLKAVHASLSYRPVDDCAFAAHGDSPAKSRAEWPPFGRCARAARRRSCRPWAYSVSSRYSSVERYSSASPCSGRSPPWSNCCLRLRCALRHADPRAAARLRTPWQQRRAAGPQRSARWVPGPCRRPRGLRHGSKTASEERVTNGSVSATVRPLRPAWGGLSRGGCGQILKTVMQAKSPGRARLLWCARHERPRSHRPHDRWSVRH